MAKIAILSASVIIVLFTLSYYLSASRSQQNRKFDSFDYRQNVIVHTFLVVIALAFGVLIILYPFNELSQATQKKSNIIEINSELTTTTSGTIHTKIKGIKITNEYNIDIISTTIVTLLALTTVSTWFISFFRFAFSTNKLK